MCRKYLNKIQLQEKYLLQIFGLFDADHEGKTIFRNVG